MSKWTDPGKKTGRCRLDCGKGFSIIEHPLKHGKSYQLEVRPKGGKHFCIRMDKSRIKDRESAYEEHLRLRIKLAEQKDDIIDNAKVEVSTFLEAIPIYLKDKIGDGLRHLHTIELIMWNRLKPFFGRMLLKEIKLQTLKKYRDERRAEGVADSTIKQELGYLKEMFQRLIDLEKYEGDNPVNIKKLKLKPQKERKRYLTAEEEALIFPLLKKHPPMDDLATFIFHTAMRPDNIIKLTWSKIRWDERVAFVPAEEDEYGLRHKQKEKDGEYLLDDEVLKMLKRRYKENQANGKSPYVFYRYEDGEPKPIKSKWYQRKWNLIKEETGIKAKEEKKEAGYEEPLWFYDLKATCISLNASMGASENLLMKISNHSSTQSLQRYIRDDVLKESALELMKRRNQLLNANGKK